MFDAAVPSHFLTPDYHASAGAPLPVIDPATLGQVGHYASTTPAELSRVLGAVNAAQVRWKAVDAKTRAQHLHRLANRIEAEDFTQCAILMSREMGKPYPEAIGELANCAPVFRYFAEMARDDAGKVAGVTYFLAGCEGFDVPGASPEDLDNVRPRLRDGCFQYRRRIKWVCDGP